MRARATAHVARARTLLAPCGRVLPPLLAALGAATGVVLMRQRQRVASAERLAAATLETLLNAIDANDPETGAHVRRVAAYAITLAKAAGLDEEQRRSVERVALFHDIGKIDAALFDIIHDESDLSEEERAAVRTHPKRGADVLEPLCAFYPDLSEGVLSHHERWDGGGYPRQLRGERIPLSARVVAIADTFDAVTASRRYRAGQGVERGIEVIRTGRGTQFDPRLVDLFLSEPVRECVERLERQARAGRPRKAERRRRRQEPDVPNVRFRWRDELRTG
jgi:HD-GYP domain-containing protein (c-di-GMP phosphodiesterase class II)